jgi:hypothetical protein
MSSREKFLLRISDYRNGQSPVFLMTEIELNNKAE